MEDLFVKQPEFEKTSTAPLSQESGKWTKEIISHFHEEFPQLVHLPVRLTFTTKDESRGYAIGSISVGENNIHVPVVVEDFSLKDLDVAVVNGNLVPLTEESVGMLFTHGSAFSKVVPNEEVDETIRLFSKSLHVPWTVDKYASVLDDVAAGITKKAQQALLDEVESNPQLKENFIQNNTYDVIEKIAELECDDTVIEKEQLEKLLPRNIYTIEKTGKFEYTAYLGNSDVDNRVAVKLKEEDVKDAYNTLEKSAAVREYKDFVLASKITSEAPVVDFEGKDTNVAIFADDAGNYFVKEARGITTQVTPTGKFAIKMPQKLPSTNATKAETGQALPPADGSVKTAECKTPAKVDKKKKKMLKKADFGVFLFENGVTKPIFLEKVSNINGKIDIEAFDGLNSIKIGMWDGIKSPAYDKEKDTYFLPKSTDFVKLGDWKENMVDFPEKTPSGDWVLNIDGNSYAFGGPNFEKYGQLGHSLNDVSHQDAKWYMVQMGAAPSEIEKIALKEGQRYYFKSDLSCPRSFDSYVEEWNKKVANFTDMVDDKLTNMVKHAAVMNDNLTVDAVLSLKFLNKKNVAEFFKVIPVYEHVIMSLSRLLLAVRLGMESVPETAVKEAMENLTIVTSKLHELQSIAKRTKN